MQLSKEHFMQFYVFIKYYSIFFLIGAVTALSQAPMNWFFCSIIGFSAFFYFLRKRSEDNYLWSGHFFGFGYFLISLYWIGNALLTDTSQFGIFLPFAYIGLPFALAFFYGVAGWGYQKLYKKALFRYNIFAQYICFIVILALCDFLRGHILTGFPWNLPVYTTAFSTVTMQPSFLFGIYGYNFIWLLFAGSFALYFFKIGQHIYSLTIAQLFVAISLSIYGYVHISDTPKEMPDTKTYVRIIQPNIQQKLKWSAQEAASNFETLLELSQKDLKPNHTYVFIWPETALPYNPEYDFAAASKIIDLLDDRHTLITGKMRYVEKDSVHGIYEFYNSLFKFTPDGGIYPVFDKVHLVPFGEYLPLGSILRAIGFSQINFFKSEFSSGAGFSKFQLVNDIHASGLICYEAIFPQYSQRIKNNGSDVIINVTNDAWFGDSFGPYQHLVQTRFRAVENNIPIIRSANTGISSFIDKNGHILASIEYNSRGYIELPTQSLGFSIK